MHRDGTGVTAGVGFPASSEASARSQGMAVRHRLDIRGKNKVQVPFEIYLTSFFSCFALVTTLAVP